MKYKYGTVAGEKRYVSPEERSVRDLTRTFKPVDARKFVDNHLLPKYSWMRGQREGVLKTVESELRAMKREGIA